MENLKKYIQNLLKKYNIYPSKKLGQNFLINKKVYRKIIKAANLQKKDFVLEIGPGIGNLTRELAQTVKRVIAVEKDLKMAEILKETLKNYKNVEIIFGDILKIKNWKFKNKKFKLVANLPYYIVSPVIRRFLEEKNPPKEMILMVQKEVAQRICASPPDMNLLAVSVQVYAEPKILSYVSKNSFWPRPKVDGAIIKITPYGKKSMNIKFLSRKKNLLFKIVRAGFSQPRKQILNNLAVGLNLNKEIIKSWLSKNNIQPIQRAETLTVGDWLSLAKNFEDLFFCFPVL